MSEKADLAEKLKNLSLKKHEGDFVETTDYPIPTSKTAFRQVLASVLKQIATHPGDLGQMSMPAAIMSGRSILEYTSHWCDYPELFHSVSKGEESLDRMVNVVRWYVSTLFGSYGSRTVKGDIEKKPFNPILGEQFFCCWPHEKYGETFMNSEQVTHHPPVSAFYFHNAKGGVTLTGESAPTTKFTGTAVKVKLGAKLHLEIEGKESYSVFSPDVYLRGVLTGEPFIELCGKASIVSSAGDACLFEFIPKGWFSGEYNNFEAKIYRHSEVQHKKKKIAKDVFYTIKGNWKGQMFIHKGDDTSSPAIPFFDASNPEIVRPLVRTIKNQRECESQRVWSKVAEALMKDDLRQAAVEKNEVEEAQRAIRKERKENNVVWSPKFFRQVDDSLYTLEQLEFESTSSVNSRATSPDEVPSKKLQIPGKKENGQRWDYIGPKVCFTCYDE